MNLVIDIGNSRIKAAFFLEGKMESRFGGSLDEFKKFIGGKKPERILASSVNGEMAKEVEKTLAGIEWLKVEEFEKRLDVEDKKEVGADRIANIYGALYHFPSNDCIVVDIGTAVTFDYVTKDGNYLGGAIYPGMGISAKGLAEETHALPEVRIVKPESAMGKTTVGHIQSGVYFGMLGAVERIVAELKLTQESPSSVMVLATGGMTEQQEFREDLSDFVDCVDPHLTLVGLNEILTERK
jgi:type III pantothenate kinase